ncbi:hypothetical protein HPB51_024227 [Rhipicephalus microplus]|uniref:Uncharacterized protein n=1 Tax=Rhipicephalus microplus TaxID=6941 RepID=A0A9J6DYA4_RHIMP|nr:hypothetical protein HPB51_024227 [Rhipicephalus microplus]
MRRADETTGAAALVPTTSSYTRQQLERGGCEFIDKGLNRDLAFMRGVANTVQYWQERRKALFAIVRQLGKPHVFPAISAAILQSRLGGRLPDSLNKTSTEFE